MPDMSRKHRKISAGADIINPGGVGQPRDGDPRASYAIYDSEIMPAIESVEMQRRIESEKHGVGDLKSGRYSRLIRGGLRVVLNRPEVDIVQS